MNQINYLEIIPDVDSLPAELIDIVVIQKIKKLINIFPPKFMDFMS